MISEEIKERREGEMKREEVLGRENVICWRYDFRESLIRDVRGTECSNSVDEDDREKR